MCKQLTDWFQPVWCPSLLFTVAALESLRFIVLVDCSEERAALQFLHQLEPSAGGQTPKQPRTAVLFHGDGSSESPHHYSAVYIAPVQFPTFPQGRLILASLALRLSVGTQTQLLPCTLLCRFFTSMFVAVLCWSPAGWGKLLHLSKDKKLVPRWARVLERLRSRTSKNVFCGME